VPTLKIRDSYTKQVEPFQPLDPNAKIVTIYSCGPTVYSHAHIGNFRSFLLGDVLRRTLELLGFDVRHVMNITDVGHMTEDHLADATGEDKLAKAARELGSDPFKVAAHFERLFAEDAKALRLRNYEGAEASEPDLHPRATAHVPEMLAMIQTLIERGHAYVDGEGQVYFAVSTFADYGRLSGKVLDELEAGARIAVRSEKRDPRDFALWKTDKKHLMQWDPHDPGGGWAPGDFERLRALAPQGIDARVRAGFPGWHIECSAMSRASLGAIIDLHTGGEDNVFPHHECEIAQSWGARATDDAPSSFCRHWVHARHLLVNGAKMSKRDGTFITARDLFDPRSNGREELATALEAVGFEKGRVAPAVLRFALTSSTFTQQMNFTLEALAQAKSSVERLQSLYERVRDAAREEPAVSEVHDLLTNARAGFEEALCDNLNTARALAELFQVVSTANTRPLSGGDAAAVQAFLERADDVFAVLDRRVRSGSVTREALVKRAASLAATTTIATEGTPEPDAIVELLASRLAARQSKDFARADAIRKELAGRGVDIEDTSDGVRWRYQ
jgi:cysteinyl-tRNA synthetase